MHLVLNDTVDILSSGEIKISNRKKVFSSVKRPGPSLLPAQKRCRLIEGSFTENMTRQ